MNRKYEFTGETNPFGLHRIRAVRSFGGIEAGDFGGWIASEDNLSHDGNAWVADNAMVFDDARISGDALVMDKARITERAIVTDAATVKNHAVITDSAVISGQAELFDCAVCGGDAVIDGRSCVGGTATVRKTSDVLTVYPLGDSGEAVSFFCTSDGMYAVCFGLCWTIEDFINKVPKMTGSEYECLQAVCMAYAHFAALEHTEMEEQQNDIDSSM
ncbi:MAG: hypothetical protein Q4F79_04470 [Eubacteriales bacterium]|nr:hypothetical protein [Eubacteriales bacterium]